MTEEEPMSDVGSDVPVVEHSTEGDGDHDHAVPPELLFLHEVLEWQRAVEAGT